MNDGLGSASYVYNNLAQMSSEMRTFNGLGSYTLSYEYNLAGELKNVTNPWGAQVGYDYDKAGRLQNVSGSGYAGVSNYASSLSYRAFGAIKGMSYGDGHALSTGYDDRLRATTWNVSGVLGYNYTYNYTYLHESTGRVSYAQSIYDSTLDRSYEYDQVGRLAISHSGTEARAHVFDGNLWGTMDGPYSQGYDYDVWGNVTHKYGWGGEVQGGSAGQSSDIWYSYTGNRRNGFGYDAAGNLTNDGTQSFIYDATGQQTYASGIGAGGSAPTFTDDPLVSQVTVIKLEHLTELRAAVNQLRTRAGLPAATWSPDPDPQRNVTLVKADHIRQLRTKLEEALNALHLSTGGYAHPTLTVQTSLIYAIDFQELRTKIKDAWTALASSSALNQSYDGDGLRVKKAEYGWTTWYLRSSVLGGQVIAEIDGNNVWQRGYVYAGSSLMAVQQGGVFWMHEDPITKSKRTTDANGNVVSSIELDPWGADANRSSSGAFQPRKYTSYDRDGNGSDEAMFRRYNRKNSRFDQPDPYDSYNLTDPQSFNRYAYVQNDPANFVDPTGLMQCVPGNISAECDSSGFGGWGGGYGGGNGWGTDPHPGLRIIHETEKAFDIVWERGHWGREGHPRGWVSDFDPKEWDAAIKVAAGVEAALQILANGCLDQTWYYSDVLPGNRYFANVQNPDKYTKGWKDSFSIHVKGAKESPPLPGGIHLMLDPTMSFDFVVKYYPGQGMAVTSNTTSFRHNTDATGYALGLDASVNVRYATEFLDSAPKCKK